MGAKFILTSNKQLPDSSMYYSYLKQMWKYQEVQSSSK